MSWVRFHREHLLYSFGECISRFCCRLAAALLEYNQGFPEKIIQSYTRQILQGLHHLHMSNIAHRDIKGDNILIDNEGVVKIADFGAAVQIPEGEDTVHVVDKENTIGTILWNAPELYHFFDHGLPVDIWSLGYTVVEMYTGRNALADTCGNNGYRMRKQMDIGNTPSHHFLLNFQWWPVIF